MSTQIKKLKKKTTTLVDKSKPKKQKTFTSKKDNGFMQFDLKEDPPIKLSESEVENFSEIIKIRDN